MAELLAKYAQIAVFYIPLGVVGIWRWSVWAIRKAISFFYRIPRGDYNGTLSIITPVYNENPKFFKLALESWKQNQPDEIIAVIDYTDKNNVSVFKEFAKSFSGARLIVTPKPGKREALADGVRVARSEIVALVDSDTIWSKNIVPKMLAPFSDPEVGGTGPRQDVLHPETLAQKLFKIRLDNRFYTELAFLAAAGDAVTCLSGRTAVYRRETILPFMDDLVGEKFLEKKVISGDDKTLTRFVQAAGWKTRYVQDTIVYTPGFADMRTFLKQILRWSRNSWRSDLKTLGSSWVWRREPALALHMADRFFPIFTMLLGPIYFFISLYFGYWQLALILFIWWMVSRAVKIFPHLRERPQDIFMLPVYVAMTYVESLIKLYALISIDEQGWITRWDKNRLNPINFLRKALSYAATLAIISGLFFLTFNFKNTSLKAAQLEKQKTQVQKFSIYTPDISRVSDANINQTKADLLSKNQDNTFGYYVVKPGDTVAVLRSRYNLGASGKILNAQTKAPISNFAFLRVGQQVAIPVNDLRNPLDAQALLRTDFLRKPPRVAYDRITNTIFVKQGGSIATLAKIQQALGPANANLLQKTQNGEWILRSNLYIGKNVNLVLVPPEVTYLKLKSDAKGYIWVRSESGNMLFSGVKVTSWDETAGAPDTNYESGRAYVTAKNSGRMDIVNSEMAYLGYAGLPRRGAEFGGSYGVSWKIKNGGFKNSLLTGVVTNNKIHDNFFGLYTFGATGMVFRNNELYNNAQYGLDPHDDSNNLLIENNVAYGNGRHGIIISKRCFANIIRNNTAYDNKLHGIMLDRSSDSNLVEGNIVYGNTDGIAIYDSGSNVILGNNIHDNMRGIRLNQNSSNNYFESNTVLQNSRGAYLYGGANKNIFFKNEIQGNDVGITLKGAYQNILYDNFAQGANKKDGRATADSYGNDIK